MEVHTHYFFESKEISFSLFKYLLPQSRFVLLLRNVIKLYMVHHANIIKHIEEPLTLMVNKMNSWMDWNLFHFLCCKQFTPFVKK